MNVQEAVSSRRAKRALSAVTVPNDKVRKLIEAMRLSPSCFNNQPWRVVVVDDFETLTSVRDCLHAGNVWATRAPLIMAVCSRAEDDCRLSDLRHYHHFSCGLAVGEMLLTATELGLIAHPIAGYDPVRVKSVLGVPESYVLITLIICGYLGEDVSLLSENQLIDEKSRPVRKSVANNFFHGKWEVPWQTDEGHND